MAQTDLSEQHWLLPLDCKHGSEVAVHWDGCFVGNTDGRAVGFGVVVVVGESVGDIVGLW